MGEPAEAVSACRHTWLVCLSNCFHGDHWPCYWSGKEKTMLICNGSQGVGLVQAVGRWWPGFNSPYCYRWPGSVVLTPMDSLIDIIITIIICKGSLSSFQAWFHCVRAGERAGRGVQHPTVHLQTGQRGPLLPQRQLLRPGQPRPPAIEITETGRDR